jgi:hypothetical protein
MPLITQELIAPVVAWTRSPVIRLTHYVFHMTPMNTASGLFHAKLLIVTADWQAVFVSTQELVVTLRFVISPIK